MVEAIGIPNISNKNEASLTLIFAAKMNGLIEKKL
jgi:hypothetical protein